MSNLVIDPFEWLKDQFEFEFCAECGGDEYDHFAIPFLGNWLARCIDGPAEDEAVMEARMKRSARRLHV